MQNPLVKIPEDYEELPGRYGSVGPGFWGRAFGGGGRRYWPSPTASPLQGQAQPWVHTHTRHLLAVTLWQSDLILPE